MADSAAVARTLSVALLTVRDMQEFRPKNAAAFESNLDAARRAADGLSATDPAMTQAPTALEAGGRAALHELAVEFLRGSSPGFELMRVLHWLRPTELEATGQLAWLQAHARCAAWWAAKEAEVLVAFAGAEPETRSFEVRGETVQLEDVAREEIAASMRWTSNFAQYRLNEARMLTTALPETLAALQAGDVSPAHVRLIVESAGRLSTSAPKGSAEFRRACLQLEQRVLPIARREGLGRSRAAANRAVAGIDPTGRTARRDHALRGRGVWLRDEPDGVATLIARMATEHAHACYAAVEHAANTAGLLGNAQDIAELGMGERRSMALLHLTLSGSETMQGRSTSRDTRAVDSEDASDSTSAMPAGPVLRTHVDVVIDLPTLLGLQDNDGEIVGGGELSGAVIRDLVLQDKSATMRRLVTDGQTGHLLDVGRKRYVVPDALREFIVMRDQRCRFPGCERRADGAELDHAVPWDDGGRSDRGNLGALCKRHHQVKTLGGWTITESSVDGACSWASPTGHRFEHRPVPVSGSSAVAEAVVPLPDRDVGETRDLIDDDS